MFSQKHPKIGFEEILTLTVSSDLFLKIGGSNDTIHAVQNWKSQALLLSFGNVPIA